MATRSDTSPQVSVAPMWLSPVASVDLDAWLGAAPPVGPLTSNVNSGELPFQRWYRFKEAFSPHFVADAIASLGRKPETCCDPFGGSGTTALTCQFLGVRPTTIEVNPFLGDLIEAKLSTYDSAALGRDFSDLLSYLRHVEVTSEEVVQAFIGAPPTFVEPGLKSRWIFDADVAARVVAYRKAIHATANLAHQRLFRVVVGAALVGVSNVLISGKGRRYRQLSAQHKSRPADLDRRFEEGFQRALFDLTRFSNRSCREYHVLKGDARAAMRDVEPMDILLCSPPYPNSFDYTDIYNVELWALGYLENGDGNRSLREATLRSHVQIKRPFGEGDLGSPTLAATLDSLNDVHVHLWDLHIPLMVRAYFEDLLEILQVARGRLRQDGRVLLVVGDSCYAGVHVDVAGILIELAPFAGLRCEASHPVRVMRSSAQQGSTDLRESLLRLAPA